MADYPVFDKPRAGYQGIQGGQNFEGYAGISPAFAEAVDKIMFELGDLLVSKHSDYGPKNISEAPGGAMNGLLVRMHDKMARLKNLTYNKTEAPNHESVEDSLKDLANYAVIGLLVLRGQWDNTRECNDTLLIESQKLWSKQ